MDSPSEIRLHICKATNAYAERILNVSWMAVRDSSGGVQFIQRKEIQKGYADACDNFVEVK